MPELHIVGVYETHPEHSFECSPPGWFYLHVTRPGAQLLVLSAYEPVRWVVTAGPSTLLQTIYVEGYSDASVDAPGVSVQEHTYEGTGDYVVGGVYAWPSPDATTLITWAEAQTGLGLTSLHAAYCMSELTLD